MQFILFLLVILLEIFTGVTSSKSIVLLKRFYLLFLFND